MEIIIRPRKTEPVFCGLMPVYKGLRLIKLKSIARIDVAGQGIFSRAHEAGKTELI